MSLSNKTREARHNASVCHERSEMVARDGYVPLVGPSDGWPRTSDGHLVRPGSMVCVYGSVNQCVRNVYDGGEYGHCVQIEDAEGPQGWAPLRDCTHENDQLCSHEQQRMVWTPGPPSTPGAYWVFDHGVISVVSISNAEYWKDAAAHIPLETPESYELIEIEQDRQPKANAPLCGLPEEAPGCTSCAADSHARTSVAPAKAQWLCASKILRLNNRRYKNAERAREAMAQMVAAGLAEWDADQKKVRLT